MRHAYACEAVVVGDVELPHHAVVVEGSLIADVVPVTDVPGDVTLTHLDGAYLTPGLVDIHVHGALGHSYNDDHPDAPGIIGRALLDAGVTTALPTLVSDSIDTVLRRIPAVLADSGQDRPHLPGVHLEGPYLSPEQSGAHAHSALREPADGSWEALLEVADQLRIVVVAPELPGATQLVEALVARGVVMAAGHTDGTATHLADAQAAGLSHVTHLFSGQSSTRRVGATRVPGVLEGSLTSDGLTVELIADGVHLPAELMRLAHRCLAGYLCLVSDATPGAGLPDGSLFSMAGQTYCARDGVGRTLDGTSFAGSTTFLSGMLPIARDTLGISVGEAVAMATSIPARAAGLSRVGILAPGNRADLLLLDDDLRPRAVALDGRWLPRRKDTP